MRKPFPLFRNSLKIKVLKEEKENFMTNTMEFY